MTKIRFLATADLHSKKKILEYIKKNAPLEEIDFVFLGGDISEKNNDFADLLEMFKNKRIFMVPGNHETKKKIEILKKHYNIDLIGNRPILLHDDLAIFGTNYINIGPYGIPEEKIFENLIANFHAIKDVKNKILLSHLPPAGTKIGDASPFFPFIGGSDAVKEFLEHFHPDIALVGHIHETSGLEEIINKTKVINVGQTFKVFEFDTQTGKLEIINKPRKQTKNKK